MTALALDLDLLARLVFRDHADDLVAFLQDLRHRRLQQEFRAHFLGRCVKILNMVAAAVGPGWPDSGLTICQVGNDPGK